MGDPELVGSHAGRVRELVHERLDGEDVAERAEAPRRRRTDRAAADEVAGDAAVADVVERIGVAVRAAVEPTAGSWPRAAARLGTRPGRQQAGALGTDRERAAGVGVAVDVVVPRAQPAVLVQPRRQLHDHRRRRRLEAVLVGPGPLHLHRLARGGGTRPAPRRTRRRPRRCGRSSRPRPRAEPRPTRPVGRAPRRPPARATRRSGCGSGSRADGRRTGRPPQDGPIEPCSKNGLA